MNINIHIWNQNDVLLVRGPALGGSQLKHYTSG